MNTLFNLTVLIAALLLVAVIVAFLTSRPGRQFVANLRGQSAFQYLANGLLVNVTPKGRATKLADNAFTLRYLLAKRGTDSAHVDICTAADLPLGVVPDMNPTVADLTYPLPVHYLGLNEDTERVVASAAIALDAFVVPAAAGKVKTLPTSGGGSTYIIGRAVTAAAADLDQIEIVPCFPIPTTIAA